MNVLVLDPGERVGWCSAVIENEPEWGDAAASLVVTGHGIAYLKDMALALEQAVVVEKKYDLVIYEKWILTAKGARVSVGSAMESSQFVGILRDKCWRAGVRCVGQRAAVQTPGGSAERALKCGHPSAAAVQEILDKLPKSHDESHDRSALLHLWWHFFEEYV